MKLWVTLGTFGDRRVHYSSARWTMLPRDGFPTAQLNNGTVTARLDGVEDVRRLWCVCVLLSGKDESGVGDAIIVRSWREDTDDYMAEAHWRVCLDEMEPQWWDSPESLERKRAKAESLASMTAGAK